MDLPAPAGPVILAPGLRKQRAAAHTARRRCPRLAFALGGRRSLAAVLANLTDTAGHVWQLGIYSENFRIAAAGPLHPRLAAAPRAGGGGQKLGELRVGHLRRLFSQRLEVRVAALHTRSVVSDR